MAQVATLLLSQRLDATTGNLSGRIERPESVETHRPQWPNPQAKSIGENSTESHATQHHRSDLLHLRNPERRTHEAKEGQTQQAWYSDAG